MQIRLDPVVKTGTILAFSGTSFVSWVIRLRTWSRISHIGVCYDGGTVVESTSLRGFTGVVKHPLSDVLENYKGSLYACEVHPEIRRECDDEALKQFLDEQVGKPYDYIQAGQSGADLFDRLKFLGKATRAQANESAWFCSEIGYRALEVWGGGLFPDMNESEVTPRDIWRIPWVRKTRIL